MSFDTLLIRLIRERDLLYNYDHQHYRNHDLRDIEWRAIAAKLKCTPEQCKRRWTTLRDRYHRIKRRERIGAAFNKKWKHYDALNFLPTIKPRSMEPYPPPTSFGDDDDDDDNTQDTSEKFEEVQTAQDTKHKQDDSNDITSFYNSFAEETKCNIEAAGESTKEPESSSAPATTTTKSTSSLFFEYISNCVKAANLDTIQQMRLEADILNFTVEKLCEIQTE